MAHGDLAAPAELGAYARSVPVVHERLGVFEAQRSRLFAAARGGDLATLESMLAADVVAWGDGGGKARAARRPVRGAARVARYLAGWMSREIPDLRVLVTELNGQPGILGIAGGQLLGAIVLDVADDRVVTVRTVANPDKLTFLAAQVL